MGGHRHICSTEGDKIAYWFAIGETVREMARRLSRSPSSVSNELKRNRVNGIYHSIHANKASVERKKNSRKNYLLQTREILKSYVFEKLDLGWSPEQIAGRLKREIKDGKRPKEEYIKHESIYQYIYDPEHKELKLWEKLARSHMKRRRWLGRRTLSARVPHRVSIRQRPEEVNIRAVFGHWEGDTIVGKWHKTGIHTEVERVSRLLFAQIIPSLKAKHTSLAQLCIFNGIPRQARKSTTLDNGSENYLHDSLQEELAMRTYFADPYSAWQRGTNEYTNSLVRRYFPKQTDFRCVTQEELNAVVDRINNTPKKVLGYKTPLEVFSNYLFESTTRLGYELIQEYESVDNARSAGASEAALSHPVV